MYNVERKIITFRYNSYWDEHKKNNRTSEISIEYVSKSLIDIEEYLRLKKEFNSFITNDNSEDIVNITSKIKEIFKELPEYKLDILISHGDNFEQAMYEKGFLIYCGFGKKIWDDEIFVREDRGKIYIEYKKDNQYITNIDSINAIYGEINTYLQKIIELRKFDIDLEKEEEQVMIKK